MEKNGSVPNCWTQNLTIGVFCMTKYDYGLKKQVVKACLNGDGGYDSKSWV